MGTFGDGNEHDVHDADSADDKGDAGDNRENARDNREERAGGVGELVAVGNGEVGVAGVGEAERVFNVFDGFVEGVGCFGADIDLLDLERAGGNGKFFGIDEQGIIKVEIVKVNRVVDFGKDANDEKFSSEEG